MKYVDHILFSRCEVRKVIGIGRHLYMYNVHVSFLRSGNWNESSCEVLLKQKLKDLL